MATWPGRTGRNPNVSRGAGDHGASVVDNTVKVIKIIDGQEVVVGTMPAYPPGWDETGWDAQHERKKKQIGGEVLEQKARKTKKQQGPC